MPRSIKALELVAGCDAEHTQQLAQLPWLVHRDVVVLDGTGRNQNTVHKTTVPNEAMASQSHNLLNTIRGHRVTRHCFYV